MKTKSTLCLLTSLTVGTIGALPIASCAQDFLTNKLHNEDTVKINFSPIVGSGHTFEGEPEANKNQDYRCRFISKTYEVQTGVWAPTHKQLQKKDVEVICNDTDIMQSCSLSNNVLIIPAVQLVGDITINLLGAEIADWIPWGTLQQISDDDIRDEKRHIAKELFEVGDYKMLRKNAEDINYATIIGFEQKDYAYIDGKEKKYIPAPFNFEILEPMHEQRWGETTGESQYYVPDWEEGTKCWLWNFSNKLVTDQTFGITPRTVDINTNSPEFSYFFVLNLKDQTGKSTGHDKDVSSGAEPIDSGDPKQSDNATFSYYRLNEYKCWRLNTISKRVIRSKERWVNNVVGHFVQYDHMWFEAVIFFDPNNHSEYRWAYKDIEQEKYTCWAFCL